MIEWCRNCILPNSRPNLTLSSDGQCNACTSHTTKVKINWREREQEFLELTKNAQKVSNKNYDCLIPVSGGKDSTWQTIKCLQYGLKPLAVTWKTPGRTDIGRENIENLISLGVDHIDYQVSPIVEAKFMLKTFRKCGTTALPMHLAIFNIPLLLAAKFNIPLIVWGENSAFEYGAKKENDSGFKLTNQWLKTYGVTHGTTAEDWIGDDLSRKDLIPYFGPKPDDLEADGIDVIFLGHYFEWDPQITKSVAESHGFKTNFTPRVGIYDFADIDDDFISIHHWLKWYKFGFTRSFDNLSLEIRNKRISRNQALKEISGLGDETPHADIKRFCSFAGIQIDDFFSTAEKFRNKAVWKLTPDGRWYIPNFILKDWNWR